ncbi:hypothetical protein R3P38DRAFT_3177540 [Favolaschia claudopus]|uniref:Uncharacterized protein n=1 Tax=Favolaschia claudopus TaxID=2862362 RepID=A0AAW0D272_9AGAR
MHSRAYICFDRRCVYSVSRRVVVVWPAVLSSASSSIASPARLLGFRDHEEAEELTCDPSIPAALHRRRSSPAKKRMIPVRFGEKPVRVVASRSMSGELPLRGFPPPASVGREEEDCAEGKSTSCSSTRDALSSRERTHLFPADANGELLNLPSGTGLFLGSAFSRLAVVDADSRIHPIPRTHSRRRDSPHSRTRYSYHYRLIPPSAVSPRRPGRCGYTSLDVCAVFVRILVEDASAAPPVPADLFHNLSKTSLSVGGAVACTAYAAYTPMSTSCMRSFAGPSTTPPPSSTTTAD